MSYQVFIVSFVVSYLGSIPPGTINISTMQLTMQKHLRAALFFALAASLVEFVYAGVTVQFQIFLSDRPAFTENFQIITAAAMIILGVANLLSRANSGSFRTATELKGRNGFKKGIILGLLNPLTIPFWLAVTAYLQANQWINLEGRNYWIYLTGITTGTFVLLLTVRKLGARFKNIADNQFLVHKLPGLIFIGLGIYNVADWYF